MKRYNQYYEWTYPRHSLTERQARLASEVLKRIPLNDLAVLQAKNTKIDARIFESRYQRGLAYYDENKRCVWCYIRFDPLDQMSESEARGIFAHELGHIFLRHCTTYVPKSLSESEQRLLDQQHEIEAERQGRAWGFDSDLRAVNEAIKLQRLWSINFGVLD